MLSSGIIMKLTDAQVKCAQELLDLLNSKNKKDAPFRLIREGDEYSFAFVLPEFGIGVKVTGPPEEKKG
jgi:hypothetical protein